MKEVFGKILVLLLVVGAQSAYAGPCTTAYHFDSWTTNSYSSGDVRTYNGRNYTCTPTAGQGFRCNTDGGHGANPSVSDQWVDNGACSSCSVGSASSSPTLCINTAMTNITHTTSSVTGITSSSGLPAGVTASYSSNTVTISGTPSASGTFNYTIDVDGCSDDATGTITVTAANTAGAASSTPTLCINNALTDITHSTTGATGISNDGVDAANGLPSGVSATWGSNTITISGTPSASGTFNYSIPLTGGCGSVNATGTITVTAANTAGAASSTPTLCVSSALTDITHATTGATGISNDGVDGGNGLPSGVSATWAGNTITISGTPSAAGTFNYSIPLTGGCGSVNATGTITVTASNTVGAASSTPTLCVNTALTDITHTTTGATGISNDGVDAANGLPAGLSATWSGNTITISGTPTATGTFNYSIPLTGGCGSLNATGTITVEAAAVGGSIASSTSVCYGDNGATLTLSGHTGAILRWESSTDNWTSTTTITNTTTTEVYSNLTATTKYRAVLQNGGSCSTENSSEATITVDAQVNPGAISW